MDTTGEYHDDIHCFLNYLNNDTDCSIRFDYIYFCESIAKLMRGKVDFYKIFIETHPDFPTVRDLEELDLIKSKDKNTRCRDFASNIWLEISMNREDHIINHNIPPPIVNNEIQNLEII